MAAGSSRDYVSDQTASSVVFDRLRAKVSSARPTGPKWSYQSYEAEPLSVLDRLVALDISVTRISDLRPLGSLEQLKWLNMVGHREIDLGPLRHLPRLEKIWVTAGSVLHNVGPLQERISTVENRSVNPTLNGDSRYSPVMETPRGPWRVGLMLS